MEQADRCTPWLTGPFEPLVAHEHGLRANWPWPAWKADFGRPLLSTKPPPSRPARGSRRR